MKGLVALARDIWRTMRGRGTIITVTWDGDPENDSVEYGQYPTHQPRKLEVLEWMHRRTNDASQRGDFRIVYHDPEMPVVHMSASNSLPN